MRNFVVLALSLAVDACWGQCPAVPLQIRGAHCTGDTLWVTGSSESSEIDWYRNGVLVKAATGSMETAPETVVAGGNGLGYAADQFYVPECIQLDAQGQLYVADLNNWRVQLFPPGSTGATNGTTIIQPVVPDYDNGITSGYPHVMDGMALDGHGNIFTNENGIIYKYKSGTKTGIQVATVTNNIGSTTGVLGRIAVDGNDNVYVVEPGNNRIQKWAPGATSGITVAGGNGAGSAANQLDFPIAACLDPAGNLYVTDLNNARVQKWAPGAVSGVTVASGNGKGTADNQMNYPAGIYVDGDGNIYIADALNQRVQWWQPGATKGVTVTGGNGLGNALNQLGEPSDVFLGPDGYLYVCDDSNERVVKNLPHPVYTIDTILVINQPGVYTAVVAGADGCKVTSQPLTVQATTTTTIAVTATPNPVCSTDSVVCSALPGSSAPDHLYTWTVNGQPITDTGPLYVYRHPADGAAITCRAEDTAACISGSGNTVALTVYPSPQVTPDQVFSMTYGTSVTLEPHISGSALSYSWTPTAGLSDPEIRNPVASPVSTTYYTLKVSGDNGCTDSGVIKVDVFTPLRVPNAFTPNGDGRNDVFYVLGGPQGTVVHAMAIFDRWGHRVFEAKDVAPGDAGAGWTGRSGDQALPSGTYVYLISLRTPDGKRQDYKGTVELIR